MTERLDRALQALRETEDGKNPDAEATLQRVLRGAMASRRGWAKRARSFVPVAAVLAISGAALAGSGALGPMGALWSNLVPSNRREAVRGAPTSLFSVPEQASSARQDPVVGTGPAASAVAMTAATGGTQRPVPPPTTRTKTSVPRPSRSDERDEPSAAPDSSASEAAPDQLSDEDLYTRAHRLHFGGADPAAALVDWDEYLRRFPEGRFTPEAQYNRAIDLLKLRRHAEARAALLPFASGVYGAYHREEARVLLRSIP